MLVAADLKIGPPCSYMISNMDTPFPFIEKTNTTSRSLFKNYIEISDLWGKKPMAYQTFYK